MIARQGANLRCLKKNTTTKIEKMRKNPLPISSAINNGVQSGWCASVPVIVSSGPISDDSAGIISVYREITACSGYRASPTAHKISHPPILSYFFLRYSFNVCAFRETPGSTKRGRSLHPISRTRFLPIVASFLDTLLVIF